MVKKTQTIFDETPGCKGGFSCTSLDILSYGFASEERPHEEQEYLQLRLLSNRNRYKNLSHQILH
jgi:hypothetical protein